MGSTADAGRGPFWSVLPKQEEERDICFTKHITMDAIFLLFNLVNIKFLLLVLKASLLRTTVKQWNVTLINVEQRDQQPVKRNGC